ncbi:MAG: hypothetical protein HRU35_04285 [Rickettsiaceae bacterium]|nr:hypothetical protein [Rickettsiaceae bacterium]
MTTTFKTNPQLDEALTKTVIKLLTENADIEFISEVTGYNYETILKIKRNFNV